MRKKQKKSVNMIISGNDFEQWIDEMLTETFGREVVWTYKGVPNYNKLDVRVEVEEYLESPREIEDAWEDEWE